MKHWGRSLLFAILLTAMLALFSAMTAEADGYYYRFTSPSYTVTCEPAINPFHLSVTGNITVEYNLPAGATIVDDVFIDGAPFEHITFPKSGSGHFSPGGVIFEIYSYPASYSERVQTVINGKVVYSSTWTATCSGPGIGTIELINEAVGGSAACLPIPDGAVVGDMPLGAQAFYAPGQATNITLNPGTYWVIGEDKSGQYYQILLACQYLWVPIDTMQPSYQAPWSGQPLPTGVVG